MAKKNRFGERVKLKRFSLKFASEELQSGNRKSDSNYFRRKIRSKKIAYIHSLIKNIDQLLIVSSFTLPEIKTGLIDRFLILALRCNVDPMIIFTKSDLVDQDTIDYFTDIYEPLSLPVLIVSNPKKKGLKAVKNFIAGRENAIIGHSGVGKTTMLNHIEPSYGERTQEVSTFTKRGRHTTTRILRHELTFGGVIYDMPGLKEMDFIDLDAQELKHYYLEFESFRGECQFKNCTHNHEPKCRIKEVVKAGGIHPERYENYLRILDDLEG